MHIYNYTPDEAKQIIVLGKTWANKYNPEENFIYVYNYHIHPLTFIYQPICLLYYNIYGSCCRL